MNLKTFFCIFLITLNHSKPKPFYVLINLTQFYFQQACCLMKMMHLIYFPFSLPLIKKVSCFCFESLLLLPFRFLQPQEILLVIAFLTIPQNVNLSNRLIKKELHYAFIQVFFFVFIAILLHS